MAFTPDPLDDTVPLDSDGIGHAFNSIRTLKTRINSLETALELADTTLTNNVNTNASNITAANDNHTTHLNDTANPHSVTKLQLAIENVDNVADVDKAVSTAGAIADALNLKIAQDLSDLNDVPTALVNLGLTNLGKITKQIFTANGTWTRPSGCKFIIIECVGGGGGGGGAPIATPGFFAGGRGGGGAQYVRSIIDVTSLASAAVSMGLGGTGGNTSGSAGNSGSNTKFNITTVVSNGGVGGGGAPADSTSAIGGTGGTGGTGDIKINGDIGGTGRTINSQPVAKSGKGGNNILGFGGNEIVLASGDDGSNGTGYGSGGSGGLSNLVGGKTGGDGASGICIITEFYQ